MRHIIFIFCAFVVSIIQLSASESTPLQSILTPHTISYVRNASINGIDYIVASSYDGEVLLIDYNGTIVWENELSGYFNHDICCYDIDGDGSDEVLAANANGALYCIDSDGATLWAFKVNDVPMYSVTALELDSGERVAVCGGYDTNFYTVRVDDGEMLNKFDYCYPTNVIGSESITGSIISTDDVTDMNSAIVDSGYEYVATETGSTFPYVITEIAD